MRTELALTGERTLPGIPEETYWFRRHEATCEYFAHWISGGRLLSTPNPLTNDAEVHDGLDPVAVAIAR